MSLGTLIGILVGIILFLQAIFLGTDQYGSFFDPKSMLMVFGGTIAATFIAYNETYVMRALKAVISIFSKTTKPLEFVFTLVLQTFLLC